MEERYMTLKVKGMTIQVKVEDEGVVLDVLDKDDEVIETTYKFFHEFGIEEITFE